MNHRYFIFVTAVNKPWIAILGAISMGVLIVSPYLISIIKIGSDYRGMYSMTSDAEPHYLARIHETYDGNGPGNPFIFEYKNSVPTSSYTFSETTLALPGILFNISVPTLNLLYKFLLPTLLALLVYVLCFELTQSRPWSIVGMLAVILGHSLFNIPDILHLIRFEKVYTAFLMYARPVNPQFSSAFFFLYLICLLRASRGMGRRWYVYLGFLLGASFYVYFYSFTFLLALTMVSIITALFVKRLAFAKALIAVLVSGIMLGLPVVYQLYTFVSHPLYQDLIPLVGYHFSRQPIISLVGLVTISLLILWYFLKGKREEKTDVCFIVSLMLTAFLVINQQVITGRVLQEGHYHWYFNTPIFIITLLWLGWKMWGTRNDLRVKVVLGAVGLVSILSALFIQYSSYQNNIAYAQQIQRYGPILAWLDMHTEKESVVLANQDISQFIPVYTADNVVWEDHADYYLLSADRRKYRPEAIMQSVDLKQELKKYRVDYVVWDKVVDSRWHLEKYSFLIPIYTEKNVSIYKI
jgi:hypothetical protein